MLVLVLVLLVLLMLMLSGVQTLTLLLGHRVYAIGRYCAVRQHSHHIPYALANSLYTRAGAAALAKSASTCIYTSSFTSSSTSLDAEGSISSSLVSTILRLHAVHGDLHLVAIANHGLPAADPRDLWPDVLHDPPQGDLQAVICHMVSMMMVLRVPAPASHCPHCRAYAQSPHA